ncbi:R3H-associated N-terminal domain containing protein [Rhypophila decipiens]
MAITKLPVAPPASDDGAAISGAPQQTPGPAVAPFHQHTISNASTATVDIEAWTVSALESLNIAPIAVGTGNALSIPLDGEKPSNSSSSRRAGAAPTDAEIETARLKLRNAVVFDDDDNDTRNINGIVPPRRPPSRRDSMKKRDALLKGKEGSRQRRRWENDHLLHVPNVQPPQPTDWLVLPTHTVHTNVPYQLAQYWDKGLRERVEERKVAWAVHRRKMIVSSSGSQHRSLFDEPATATATATVVSGGGTGNKVSIAISSASAHTRADVGKVPKDLRATAKRTPAVKSWLRVLEEPVRQFMVDTMATSQPSSSSSKQDDSDEMDSEDEEIVFVGRNGKMRDGKEGWKKVRREQQQAKAASEAASVQSHQLKRSQGLVLDSLGEDETGAFKRWLTHSISDYYGLDSRSMTVGNPARRVVYVGVKQVAAGNIKAHHHHHHHQHHMHAPPFPPVRMVLPPPLWEMF